MLLEYLHSQVLDDSNDVGARPIDIVRTWQFANQANAEALISSTIAVLALLLKTISSLITFRACGKKLCKLLLQDDQLKLFDRVLSASKAKDYLLAPCLKLLTEIVSFDGGHAAKMVYRQRGITMKRLEVFLGMREHTTEDQGRGRNKPSVRDVALRYLYANLRLQSPSAKTYILTQGKIVRSLLVDILEDVPSVVVEVLEALKRDVASDTAIHQATKRRFFNEWTLSQISVLYGYSKSGISVKGHQKVQEAAHDLLVLLCTTPGHGLLGAELDSVSDHDEVLSSSRDALYDGNGADKYGEEKVRYSNRHFKLAMFLQSLRPYATVLQSELILAVFRKAPELVSDYFSRKKTFSFDPKPTATWIGYYSFLLKTIEQPLPQTLTSIQLNEDLPLPCELIIDSIIPPPLSQMVTTRCLNQSVKLIKYLVIKLLISAFQKLRSVLEIFESGYRRAKQASVSKRWRHFADVLTAEFRSRIPGLNQVVLQFRSCAEDTNLLEESVTRLLALYYQVIPQSAFDVKFDISAAISKMLQDIRGLSSSSETDKLRHLVLENLMDIAHRSQDTQWWRRSGMPAALPPLPAN